MASTNQNLSFYAGDTVQISITVKDAIGNVDITGATVNFVLQYTANDVNAIISKSTSNGISITNASGGVFQVTLSHSDTKNLLATTYYHQSVVTDASGNVSTVTIGNATVYPSAKSLP